MKDFTFLMKNTNLESAVRNDGRTTVNRQSTDGQSQRQYSVGTIARPLPDSVSNPCRVRVLDHAPGISGLFSSLFSSISFARVWKYAAMIFMVLCLGVGEMWGADFTPAEIVATGGTTKNSIKVSSSVSSTSSGKKLCTTQTSVTAVTIDQAANGNYDVYYI